MYSKIKKWVAFGFKAAAIVMVAIGCFKLGSDALTGDMTPNKFLELVAVAVTMGITGSAVYGPKDEEDDLDV